MTEAGGAVLRRAMRAAGEFGSATLELTLTIADPELRDELAEYPDGPERHDFAVAALKIGVLALRHARGRIDAERVREEGERLLASLAQALAEHQRTTAQQVASHLKEYFDPQSGRFNERIERLIRHDGELEQVLRRQVGVEGSEMVRTLTAHIGDRSPLMQILDPEAANGLKATIAAAVAQTAQEQRERILQEFSLDHKDGALSRLIGELNQHHNKTTGTLQEQIGSVVAEFSLDREDSALSRLVQKVERAQRQISAEFSLDEQNSALARLKRELLDVMTSFRDANTEFQNQVLQKLAEAAARRAESLKSTRHGIDFEHALVEQVDALCQAAGDISAHVGHQTGIIRNCKKGDIVVTLGAEHAAAHAHIVIEAKEQATFTLQDALDELAEARKNREATVGVAVLSARTAPVGLAPLARYGSDVVCIWDDQDPRSDVVLTAALSVAKAMCVKEQKHSEATTADFQALERAIRAVEGRLKDFEEIQTWSGNIQRDGEKISKKATILRDDLARQVIALDRQTTQLKRLVAGSE